MMRLACISVLGALAARFLLHHLHLDQHWRAVVQLSAALVPLLLSLCSLRSSPQHLLRHKTGCAPEATAECAAQNSPAAAHNDNDNTNGAPAAADEGAAHSPNPVPAPTASPAPDAAPPLSSSSVSAGDGGIDAQPAPLLTGFTFPLLPGPYHLLSDTDCREQPPQHGTMKWPPPYKQRRRLHQLSVNMKLSGVRPEDLTRSARWQWQLRAELAAQSTGVVRGLAVREGCIELAAELLIPLLQGSGGTNNSAGGTGNDSGNGAATLGEAAAGDQQRDRPEGRLDPTSLVAALGLPCAPSRVVWALQRPAGSAGDLAKAGGLRTHAVRPYVLYHDPASEACSGSMTSHASLRTLTFRVTTSRTTALAAKRPAVPPAVRVRARGGFLDSSTAPPSAAAARDTSMQQGGDRECLDTEVVLEHTCVPPGVRLLQFDCRDPSGVSDTYAIALLVDDAGVAAELVEGLAAVHEQDLPDLLLHLGMWAEHVWRVTAAKRRTAAEAGVMDASGGRDWQWVTEEGQGAAAAPAAAAAAAAMQTGADLLQHALRSGSLRTAHWLMRGLQAMGVCARDLVPGKVLAPSSPCLLRTALSGRRPLAATALVLWWSAARVWAPTPAVLAAPLAGAAASRGAAASGKPAAALGAKAAGAPARGFLADVGLAAVQVLGLRRAGPQDERAMAAYVDGHRATQSMLWQAVSGLWLIALLVRFGVRGYEVAFAGGLPCLLSTVASIVLPPPQRHRLALATIPLNRTCLLAAEAMVGWLGFRYPFGIAHSWGMFVVKAMLQPVGLLVSLAVPLSMVVAVCELATKPAYLIQSCNHGTPPCAMTYRQALLPTASAVSVSVLTTLACHTCLRLQLSRAARESRPSNQLPGG